MLKKIMALVFFISTILAAQDITNKLGSSGTFKVQDNSSSDLVTVATSGNTTVKGTLTLTDGSDSYTLPNTDGSADQVLKTDGSGNLSWTDQSGGSSVSTQQIRFLICTNGLFPSSSSSSTSFFLGQIVIFAGGASQIPSNFHECDGSIVMINSNPSLYAVLGQTYGGDGSTYFRLPDFSNKAPLGY